MEARPAPRSLNHRTLVLCPLFHTRLNGTRHTPQVRAFSPSHTRAPLPWQGSCFTKNLLHVTADSTEPSAKTSCRVQRRGRRGFGKGVHGKRRNVTAGPGRRAPAGDASPGSLLLSGHSAHLSKQHARITVGAAKTFLTL